MNIRYTFLLYLMVLILNGCTPPEIIRQEEITRQNGNQKQNYDTAPCEKLLDFSDNDLSKYQLYIDSKGNLVNPDDHTIIASHLEDDFIRQVLNNIDLKINQLKKLKDDNKINVNAKLRTVFFIHGGLNSYSDTIERTKRLKNQLLQECQYPVFIAWDSDFILNYVDHAVFLRRGNNSEVLGPLSLPFVFMEDILRSISRIPASTYYELTKANVYLDKSKAQSMLDITANIPPIYTPQLLLGDIKSTTMDQDSVKYDLIDDISILNPLKILTAPIIDGFGTGAWDSMLRRTDFVLNKDINNINSSFPKVTAISKFLNSLEKKFPNIESILVGHSMGTIISNSIIASNQDFKFSKIIYMAAACRVKDIRDIVSPYLIHNQNTQFYNLSLNEYRDIMENTFFDFVPRGSLLVWIDNTFGDINSSMDKTAGYIPNIISHADIIFPNSIKEKGNIKLVEFGIDDNSPQKHGDFGEFPFWRSSFWEGCNYNNRCQTGKWELRPVDWQM